jgi:hypothetical protein
MKKVLNIFYLNILNIAKIWLNIVTNDCQLSNITKLRKKNIAHIKS